MRDGAEQVLARYRYDPFDRRLWKDRGGRTLYLNGAEGPLAALSSLKTCANFFAGAHAGGFSWP